MPQPSPWPARLGEPHSTCALCTHDGFPQASLTAAAREDLSECKPELSESKTLCWLWPYLAKSSSLYSPVSGGSRSGPTSATCLAWCPGAPTCLTSASFPYLEGLAVPSAWTVLPQDPCLQLSECWRLDRGTSLAVLSLRSNLRPGSPDQEGCSHNPVTKLFKESVIFCFHSIRVTGYPHPREDGAAACFVECVLMRRTMIGTSLVLKSAG